MVAILQRVSAANVVVENQQVASIQKGLVVLLGIHYEDTEEDAQWIVSKIVQMRIFSDQEGKMNLSVIDVKGDILLISQFTLLASTKKGNRPSFAGAARPEKAIPLYEYVIRLFTEKLKKPIATGIFGADMKVTLTNDGPVTIWIDTKYKL
ncbi:MAG: D-aminoacyl-tRNA deacylase [Cytophagales bacterium]|nr:D-aminoacyl-tRNA deacylase [Cytophagales bacterium]MDW8384110.1 D-aminoacyl-tRNA deacylase [Flammeovirgaceae bacterium]